MSSSAADVSRTIHSEYPSDCPPVDDWSTAGPASSEETPPLDCDCDSASNHNDDTRAYDSTGPNSGSAVRRLRDSSDSRKRVMNSERRLVVRRILPRRRPALRCLWIIPSRDFLNSILGVLEQSVTAWH